MENGFFYKKIATFPKEMNTLIHGNVVLSLGLLSVKVKEEECKNQNDLHFGPFCNCFVSKVEAQNNVEAKRFLLACM